MPLLRVLACAVLTLSTGCLSVSHRLEVRLRDADAVTLDATGPAQGSDDGDDDRTTDGVRVTGDDDAARARARALGIKPSGRDLAMGGVLLTATGTAPLTIARPLQGPVVTLPTRKGRFVWRRDVQVPTAARAAVVDAGVPLGDGGRVTFEGSTPASNVARADLITDWRQPGDILPSLAAIAVGGVFALGFGAAAVGIGQEAFATNPPDQALLNESLGFGAGATVGLALVGYGIVSWILVDSDARTPLAIPR